LQEVEAFENARIPRQPTKSRASDRVVRTPRHEPDTDEGKIPLKCGATPDDRRKHALSRGPNIEQDEIPLWDIRGRKPVQVELGPHSNKVVRPRRATLGRGELPQELRGDDGVATAYVQVDNPSKRSSEWGYVIHVTAPSVRTRRSR